MKIKRGVKRLLSLIPKSFFNFLIRLTNNRIYDKKLDNDVLTSFQKDEGKSCIKKDQASIINKYDLQIVVPCYNIQKFGKRCINSIVNQKTKYSFCLILVNDGSTDKTEEILNQYISENVKVINKKNGGSSSARNKGLETISAKYLMFVDSDDYLLNENVVENMLSIVDGVDNKGKNIIVEFSYINSSFKRIKEPKKTVVEKCKSIDFTGFGWGKIYSSALFKQVEFPESYWFEDTVLHTIIYPMADECYKSNALSYFYQLNDSGMTSQSKFSNKTLDTFYVTRSLLKDRRQLGLKDDDSFYFRFFYQTICNCNRLLKFPEDIQLAVFYETIKIFEIYNIKMIKGFKTLFLSLKERKFKQYISFCKYYSMIYLNLD